MQDFHIEGIGTINGGEFGLLKVEGVGTCSGDIKAADIRIEGVFNCSGNVDTGYLECEGVANFNSNIRAKKIIVEGVLNNKHGNKIEAEEILCEGVIKTYSEISADYIKVEGCIDANEIVGEHIIIDSDSHPHLLRRLFKSTTSEVNIIEATTINLSGIKAKAVNGKDITIGPSCVIDNIDCSGFLSIDRRAVVKNITGDYKMK